MRSETVVIAEVGRRLTASTEMPFTACARRSLCGTWSSLMTLQRIQRWAKWPMDSSESGVHTEHATRSRNELLGVSINNSIDPPLYAKPSKRANLS